MRKPTPAEFFVIEAVVWVFVLFLIGYYHDWGPRSALSVYLLKASVANVGFAIFNVVGACLSMAFHW